jgi:hypothetical protein
MSKAASVSTVLRYITCQLHSGVMCGQGDLIYINVMYNKSPWCGIGMRINSFEALAVNTRAHAAQSSRKSNLQQCAALCAHMRMARPLADFAASTNKHAGE